MMFCTGSESFKKNYLSWLFIFLGTVGVVIFIGVLHMIYKANFNELTTLNVTDLVGIDVYLYPDSHRRIVSISSEDREAIETFIKAIATGSPHVKDRNDLSEHQLQFTLQLTGNRKKTLLVHQGYYCGTDVYLDIIQPINSGYFYLGSEEAYSAFYHWLESQGLTAYLGCESSTK